MFKKVVFGLVIIFTINQAARTYKKLFCTPEPPPPTHIQFQYQVEEREVPAN